MKTYCNTDLTTPKDIREKLDQIETALGDCRVSCTNPCGGCAYCDEGEVNPWRLLYCDGVEESFLLHKEAVQAAREYANEN